MGVCTDEVPPTIILRPVVVVDTTPGVRRDPAYAATVDDVLRWEAQHGTVPAGSVVMFRSDWSLGWDGYSDTGLPEPFPAVAWQTLKFLHTQRGVVAHGHEPLDADNTPQMLSEAWVLQHGFVEYEGVANLHLVPPTGCLLAAGFPRVVGATGGLSRLVAICPHSSRHGVTIAQAPAGPLAEHEWPMRRDPDGVLRPRKGAQRVQGCPADMPLMAGCVDGKLVD